MNNDMLSKIGDVCANIHCRKWMEAAKSPVVLEITLGETTSTFLYCSNKCYKEVVTRFKDNVDDVPERGFSRVTVEKEDEVSPRHFRILLKLEMTNQEMFNG